MNLWSIVLHVMFRGQADCCEGDKAPAIFSLVNIFSEDLLVRETLSVIVSLVFDVFFLRPLQKFNLPDGRRHRTGVPNRHNKVRIRRHATRDNDTGAHARIYYFSKYSITDTTCGPKKQTIAVACHPINFLFSP